MRKLRVEYQNDAIADLREIYRFIAVRSQNSIVARGFVRRIEARCARIGTVPHGGRQRDDLESGLRTVPFEHSAVIAYKVEADLIRIVNIFYGGRDFESFYLGVAEDDDAIE